MKLLDLLFSGGAVGSLLNIAQGFFGEWQKDREAKRRIEEMKVMSESAEKKAAWDAFAASQGNELESAGVSVWVNNVRALMRPVLTGGLVVFVGWVYATATTEVRATLSDQIAFAGFTAVFWWFGSRYSRK